MCPFVQCMCAVEIEKRIKVPKLRESGACKRHNIEQLELASAMRALVFDVAMLQHDTRSSVIQYQRGLQPSRHVYIICKRMPVYSRAVADRGLRDVWHR